MTLRENLPRWLFASLSTHFKENTGGVVTHIDGENRLPDQGQDFAEFRMDGPRITELSAGEFYVWVAVNILIQHTQKEEDFHGIQRSFGLILEAFNRQIAIFKYGNGGDDDQSKLTCVNLVQRKPQDIQVNNFGIIDMSLGLQQGTIEAHYETYLQE